MKYPIAEKFKSIQGEGLYTGTPMAFIRFVGCSVGQGVYTHCDTDFDRVYPPLGGGMFSPEQLIDWVGPEYFHICLTGGEPLDRDLVPFLSQCSRRMIHIETSGTVDWQIPVIEMQGRAPLFSTVHLTVSPKPGYLEVMLQRAEEIKVILGGLGDGEGWPTVQDAVNWARRWPHKTVFLQPRNRKYVPDHAAIAEAQDIVCKYPELRLSTQFHKFISVR